MPWNGFAAVWLLVAHTVFITIGYGESDRQSLVAQTLDFVITDAQRVVSTPGFGRYRAS